MWPASSRRAIRSPSCEQVEDPAKAKGLVKRDIIRVVTPGTVIESSMLQDDKNNYIASVFLKGGAAGLCFADVSTGTAHITELKREKIAPAVIAELCRYNPSEVLMNPGLLDCREITAYIKKNMNCAVELVEEERYAPGLVAISREPVWPRLGRKDRYHRRRPCPLCNGRAAGISP